MFEEIDTFYWKCSISKNNIYKVKVNNCIEIYEIIPNVYVKLYFNDQVKAKSKVAFKTSNENG